MKNLLWVVIFAVCSSVCAHAQTIADVARRERAARGADQSGVSITNASLKKKPAGVTEEKPAAQTATPPKPAPPTTSAAATPAPAAAAPATAAPAAQPAADAEEKAWRAKFETARTDVRRAENQVALAQLELNSANRDYLTRSYDPDGRGLAAIAAAKQKLADANTAVASAKAKLTQLEEDLRRANGPPGWAR
ncbi:MAG TPA: hypothetical protein VFR18_03595 [Terriglobia bacterium]|nr:hypothetical protein [Terriglobia bacterium]